MHGWGELSQEIILNHMGCPACFRWDEANNQWVDVINGFVIKAGPQGDPINLKFMDPTNTYYNYAFNMNCCLRYLRVYISLFIGIGDSYMKFTKEVQLARCG